MNLPDAESAYMNKLEHIRRNLEGLDGLAGREARKGFRSMQRTVLLAVVLLILVTGVFCGIRLHRTRVEAQKEKEEFLWQRDAFAEMDAFHASGDYETLLTLYCDARDAGHRIWQYRHSEFCEFLLDIERASYSLRDYEAGSGDAAWLLLEELCLYRLEDATRLSEDDRAVLARLRAPLLEDLDARFHLTEEELSGFRKTLARDGTLSYSACEQFLEERGMGN